MYFTFNIYLGWELLIIQSLILHAIFLCVMTTVFYFRLKA